MPKWIALKSVSTVAVSLPTPAIKGESVKFMYEKAGSFVMATSPSKKNGEENIFGKGEVDIDSAGGGKKNDARTSSQDTEQELAKGEKVGKMDTKNARRRKSSANKLDTIDEEEVEAGEPSKSAAQETTESQDEDQDEETPELPKPINKFAADEEQMAILHGEGRRNQTALKREKLKVVMSELERELQELEGEIGELLEKEQEEIENLEGLIREVGRRKMGKGKRKMVVVGGENEEDRNSE